MAYTAHVNPLADPICCTGYTRAHRFSDIIVTLRQLPAPRGDSHQSDSSWGCRARELKVGLFLLTLALSLGEREQLSTRCEHSNDSSFIPARPVVLPLPEGEGGVRGKATLEQRDAPALKVASCCHPQGQISQRLCRNRPFSRELRQSVSTKIQDKVGIESFWDKLHIANSFDPEACGTIVDSWSTHLVFLN
jgi:hypothetical protein